MFKVTVLLAIFIVFVYVYSLRKTKGRKEKTKRLNSVQEFHHTYQHLSGLSKKPSPRQSSGEYQKYVTKYNSSEDYREKR